MHYAAGKPGVIDRASADLPQVDEGNDLFILTNDACGSRAASNSTEDALLTHRSSLEPGAHDQEQAGGNATDSDRSRH
jgi:hypothetical protein